LSRSPIAKTRATTASQPAIKQWRDRLTAELSVRECGWVKDGRPFCPDDQPLVSPWRDRRYTGRG
jgi:hypothetical protein